MTNSQKLLLEQSKKRERINEILAKDSPTAEERAELQTLTGRMQEIEPELRAAIVAEDAEVEQRMRDAGRVPDAEHRERIELRGRARLTEYLTARAQGRLVAGAEAELCAAAGVTGIPLELWDTAQPEQHNGEDRAITPAPGTVGVNLDPIRAAVFAQSIATRLGIDMPRVASGTYATGTITTSTTAGSRAKSADAPATEGAITVTTATPKRVSAQLELTLEDIAAIGAENFESILRQNLAFALSAELDDQAINGDGSAPNLTGMIKRLEGIANPTDPTARSFDLYVEGFTSAIDGLWATRAAEVGIVAGPLTYRQSAGTFRDPASGTAGGRGMVSFADYAMEHYGGWWTNSRMPDAASDIQRAIAYRMGRSGMGADAGMRTAVLPHWGEVTIDDIYTDSIKAERYFTMHVLLTDVSPEHEQ